MQSESGARDGRTEGMDDVIPVLTTCQEDPCSHVDLLNYTGLKNGQLTQQ